jgi:CDP-glucose 4,6-dehydratase
MPHILADFYRGKRVLVTGHTGFQGGWVVAWLKLLGAQVYGYGLPPARRPNFFDAIALDRGMTSIFGDIRDRNSLAAVFSESQPEIVIHCAMRSSRQLSHSEPVDTFSTNVMGAVHILEESRLTHSVRAVVLAMGGLSDEYGQEARPSESAPDVRDASMHCAEIASRTFSKSHLCDSNTAVTSARSTDTVGGGDWREGRAVPNLVRSIMCGEPVHLGDKFALRIWHVLEPVRAFLLLAKKSFEAGQQYSGDWEFTPATSRPVRAPQLAKDFVSLWDTGQLAAETGTKLQGQERTLDASEGRAESELGWSVVLPYEKAIAWTVEWYRAFYSESASAWRVTEEQIDRYMRMAIC